MSIILHDSLFYLNSTLWQLRNCNKYIKFASVFYHISYHFTSGCSSSVETLLWNGRKAGTGPFSGSCGRQKSDKWTNTTKQENSWTSVKTMTTHLEFDFQHSRSFEAWVLVLWFDGTDSTRLDQHLCLLCRCCRVNDRLVRQSCQKGTGKVNKIILSISFTQSSYSYIYLQTTKVLNKGVFSKNGECWITQVKNCKKHLLRFKPLWFVWLVELCFFKASKAFFWNDRDKRLVLTQ